MQDISRKKYVANIIRKEKVKGYMGKPKGLLLQRVNICDTVVN